MKTSTPWNDGIRAANLRRAQIEARNAAVIAAATAYLTSADAAAFAPVIMANREALQAGGAPVVGVIASALRGDAHRARKVLAFSALAAHFGAGKIDAMPAGLARNNALAWVYQTIRAHGEGVAALPPYRGRKASGRARRETGSRLVAFALDCIGSNPYR